MASVQVLLQIQSDQKLLDQTSEIDWVGQKIQEMPRKHVTILLKFSTYLSFCFLSTVSLYETCKITHANFLKPLKVIFLKYNSLETTNTC